MAAALGFGLVLCNLVIFDISLDFGASYGGYGALLLLMNAAMDG
ncbi:hypothetical protein HMPREF0868_0326 [Mageeibacillus indolicus UPII9-5]|uniref:Uncharacterized protein n=1 Tax=Mageeibacillus indolicus (strain UPII9-5) TaxID=699246 RepID=D3R0F7_MAGIU|nr:hypothetical protein HMPREF0868_0326 [Mageeibacillus indolicus UPII9-5]